MVKKTSTDLQKELSDMFSPNKVYYAPPESIKLTYPCIIFFRDYIKLEKADNRNYSKFNRYQLTVIDRDEDNPIIEEILDKYVGASYDRHYVADNLYHDVISLYY